MALEREIEVGHPEFWPVIFQKHHDFCMVAQSLGPVVDEIFSKGHTERLHTICRHLAKKTANSFSAVLMLGMNGFGHDALTIARAMFEAAVTIAYLRKHPEEIDDYMDFHFLVAMKRFRYMEKYTPERLSELSPQAVEESKRGYARVVDRFTLKNGRVRGRWSKKSFSKICAELGLQEHYLAFYDLASNITHGSISGLMAQADPEPGVLDVDIAPSDQFVHMAFSSAHCWFVLALSEYIALARPDKQSIAEKLNRDFEAVWPRSDGRRT